MNALKSGNVVRLRVDPVGRVDGGRSRRCSVCGGVIPAGLELPPRRRVRACRPAGGRSRPGCPRCSSRRGGDDARAARTRASRVDERCRRSDRDAEPAVDAAVDGSLRVALHDHRGVRRRAARLASAPRVNIPRHRGRPLRDDWSSVAAGVGIRRDQREQAHRAKH